MAKPPDDGFVANGVTSEISGIRAKCPWAYTRRQVPGEVRHLKFCGWCQSGKEGGVVMVGQDQDDGFVAEG